MAFQKNCDDCGKPISVDKVDDKWVASNLDGTPHEKHRKAGAGGGGAYRGGGGRSEAEIHDIRREAVLNAAVAWGSANLSAGLEYTREQVLETAKLFHAFVVEGRPKVGTSASSPPATSPAPAAPRAPAAPATRAPAAAPTAQRSAPTVTATTSQPASGVTRTDLCDECGEPIGEDGKVVRRAGGQVVGLCLADYTRLKTATSKTNAA